MSLNKEGLKETSSENSENDIKVSTHHIICHCHTTLNYTVFDYTWNIAKFWITFKSLSRLVTCETGNQPFNITAYFDRKNDIVRFYSCFVSVEKGFNVNCYSHIQTTEGAKMALIRENVFLSHHEFIYSVPLKSLREQNTTYVPNDTLTIYFQFEVLGNVSHNTIHENILESHMSTVNTFVPNKSDSLVSFLVEEKQLSINKSLLCSKSNVFEAMINNGLKENMSDIIKISDIKYDVFQRLLVYVKTGSLGDLNYLKMNVDDSTATVNILYYLIEAANKYNIKDLLLSCEKLLIRNTSENNVVDHLLIAHTNNANLLENYAIRFIKLYENSIVQTPDFEILTKMYPNLLINIQEVKLNNILKVTFE